MADENIQRVELPPLKLAFILDNEVVDVLHTDERLAAIFLSNPLVLDVTEQVVSDPASIQVGFIYDEASGSFVKPEAPAEEQNNNV